MSTVRAIWSDFISGHGRFAAEDPDFMRVALIHVVGAVAAPLWSLMLAYNAWFIPQTGNFNRMLVDGFGVGVSVSMLAALRLGVSVESAARGANIGILFAILGIIYSRDDPGYSLMLAAIYPPLAFLLIDRVIEGIAWSVLATVLVSALMALGLGPWSGTAFGRLDALLTVITVMTMLTTCMASYVRNRWVVFARLQELRRQLTREAIRDPLTGLHNRRTFSEALQRSLARTARDRNGLAVLMLDIDHFKAYNDLYGHPAGDVVLKRVAEVLQARFARGDDLLFRLGGEEFCALFFATGRDEARGMGERIVRDIAGLDIAAPAGIDGRLTTSAGLLWIDNGGERDAENVYRAADAALYRAKAAGRACCVLAD